MTFYQTHGNGQRQAFAVRAEALKAGRQRAAETGHLFRVDRLELKATKANVIALHNGDPSCVNRKRLAVFVPYGEAGADGRYRVRRKN